MLRSLTLALVPCWRASFAGSGFRSWWSSFTIRGLLELSPRPDSLLAELEKQQPVSNVRSDCVERACRLLEPAGLEGPVLIVPSFSERQESYAAMMSGSDVYTPQAVIDGRFTTVGSNRQNVMKAIMSSGREPKACVAGSRSLARETSY